MSRSSEQADTPADVRHLAREAVEDATDARIVAEEARVEAEEAQADIEEHEEATGTRDSTADTQWFGRLGRPLRRNSPFMLGFLGSLGVFLAWFLIQALVQARSVIILIVVSLFLAVGLNPLVEALMRRGLRRNFAIGVVFLIVISGFGAFAAAILPPVIEQTDAFVTKLPDYLDDLRQNDTIRRFDNDYQVIGKTQRYITSGAVGERMFGGLLGVGRIVLNALFSALSVLILTLYFLAALPSMKRQAYRLVPSSRRTRVQLLTDEILVRIGGYVGGAFTIASVAAVTSFLFLTIIGLPYALALAVFVGLLDLVPLVGATLAATLVSVLGFVESPAVGLACLAFFVAYQQLENYVIYPRIMRAAVDVPAALTVVAVLLGGALLGVVGALLAIPTAAAILLVVRQVAIPRMDRT